MNDELRDARKEFLHDLFEKAENVPGSITRIKDCTLIEEIRHDASYAFDDGELDYDILKTWLSDWDEQKDAIKGYVKQMEMSKLYILVNHPEVKDLC